MSTILFPPKVQEEIARLSQLAENTAITADDLEKLVLLAIKEQKSKSISKESLKLSELKNAIYQYFDVQNTQDLKKSSRFKMATDGMDKLDFSKKETWEMLYRKLIGILPDELNQEGYGCINGIDIFKYYQPWQVFNLDGQTANRDDIKKAFRQLSKTYHPDNPETGDRKIFERLNTMYEGLLAFIPK
jgi:hypothetical protein